MTYALPLKENAETKVRSRPQVYDKIPLTCNCNVTDNIRRHNTITCIARY